MNNEDIINLNVLCPWSCSTSCKEAGKIPLDIMIQKILPKVLLPLYTDPSQYRLVHFSWNQYYRSTPEDYPTILLNKKWPVKPSVQLNVDGCLEILTCQYHNGGEDKLTLFSPQSPNGHILNANQSDQLSPCVNIPRIVSSTKAMKYCTKFSMVQCQSGYNGIDTMNVSTQSDFSKTSELLSIHEDTTIIG